MLVIQKRWRLVKAHSPDGNDSDIAIYLAGLISATNDKSFAIHKHTCS